MENPFLVFTAPQLWAPLFELGAQTGDAAG